MAKSVVSQIEAIAGDLSLTPTQAADKWIANASDTEHREALRSLVYDRIVDRRRRLTARTEIAALDELRRQREVEKTAQKRTGRVEKERQREQNRTDYVGGLGKVLTKTLRPFTAALEFTEEFLNLEFVVDNRGRRVTWRDATIADHEQRMVFMRKMAKTVTEDVSRHAEVVRLLVERHVDSLGELLAKQEAK